MAVLPKISFLLVATLGVALVSSKVVPENFHVTKDHFINSAGSEQLDQEGKFLVSWTVNDTDKSICFEIKAETKGYVGFGFSPNGAMTGADIFVAGVHGNGTTYGLDYHATANTRPILDEEQNYVLDDATETATHTTIKFHRLLSTCDTDDFEITEETMKLIWSMGATDEFGYHNEVRGTKSVNFYLDDAEFEPSNFKKREFLKTTPMTAEHTMYWCTIHKMDPFAAKQHIVAFEPVLENPDALTHTHHFILYRCKAPQGEDTDKFFENWVKHDGDYCFQPTVENFPFREHCSANMIYVWTKGGKRMVFPPDIGLPMPDELDKSEYYALEIHYDNPQKLEKNFSTGARMYYTDQPRPIEAGLMEISHTTEVQLTIPPKTENYVLTGHCSGECTKTVFPTNGVTVFNNLLHAHVAGRKIKLRHFRGTEELPWIDNDNYYDFDYQQNKPVKEPRKLLQGDQLTVECTFDTMKVKDDMAVIGGLSSSEEMCQSWFFYYPRQTNLISCKSSQDLTEHMKLLGATNFTKGDPHFQGGSDSYIILEPANLAGDYLESISKKVQWTDEFRANFQQEKRFGVQDAYCSTEGSEVRVFQPSGTVKYPENLKEYVPEHTCQRTTNEPTNQPPGGTTEKCEGDECDNSSAGNFAVAKILVLVSLVGMYLH